EATFSPTNPDAIAALTGRALSDSAYRAELERRCAAAAERHTWPRVVDRLLSACARVPQPVRRRPRRPRVALVGQFAPSPSWSAGYNLRLATHLAPHCELDCFTEPRDARSDPGPPSRGFRMFPASSLGPVFTPAGYDAVLYAVGPDRDEVHRLACPYPGTVWLHDLALARGELMRRARGVIVPSPAAQAVAETELRRVSRKVPTWVVPFAVSAPADLPGRDIEPPSFDQVTRDVLRIALTDLEESRPSEASAFVTHPAA